jgi:hypothetical protein
MHALPKQFSIFRDKNTFFFIKKKIKDKNIRDKNTFFIKKIKNINKKLKM